jgi:hypothetical protein
MEPLKERLYLSVPHMSEASLRYVEEAFAGVGNVAIEHFLGFDDGEFFEEVGKVPQV